MTAVTDSGYKFDTTLPSGWDRVSDSKATYNVVFDAGFACGVPENPSLTQSICPTTGTTPVPPTLTFPTTDGVVYTAAPNGPYKGGDVVVVTATAQPGHQFDTTAPAGWTILDSMTETYTVTFDAAPSCSQPVTPTFSDDQCVGNTPSSATYTIPNTPGIDYYVDSVLTQAGTYTATDGSTIKVAGQAADRVHAGRHVVLDARVPGDAELQLGQVGQGRAGDVHQRQVRARQGNWRHVHDRQGDRCQLHGQRPQGVGGYVPALRLARRSRSSRPRCRVTR